MRIYMAYLFAGPYVWAAQVVVVAALGVLAWVAPHSFPASLQGRAAAGLAMAIAVVFVVLMAPVALMIFLRRNQRDFPTRWTHPPGLACMAQVVLLLAAGVNAAIVRAR